MHISREGWMNIPGKQIPNTTFKAHLLRNGLCLVTTSSNGVHVHMRNDTVSHAAVLLHHASKILCKLILDVLLRIFNN